jgi:hypothetical protein
LTKKLTKEEEIELTLNFKEKKTGGDTNGNAGGDNTAGKDVVKPQKQPIPKKLRILSAVLVALIVAFTAAALILFAKSGG